MLKAEESEERQVQHPKEDVTVETTVIETDIPENEHTGPQSPPSYTAPAPPRFKTTCSIKKLKFMKVLLWSRMN